MSWKPNKAGVYLINGRAFPLCPIGSTGVRYKTSSMLFEMASYPPIDTSITIADGPWSLLSPDWQEGAPSAAQLDKWKWWYMLIQGFGGITVEVVDRYMSPHGHENLIFENEDTEWVDNIIQSAPVQEDMNNGPLWVPLEVAVEKT